MRMLRHISQAAGKSRLVGISLLILLAPPAVLILEWVYFRPHLAELDPALLARGH